MTVCSRAAATRAAAALKSKLLVSASLTKAVKAGSAKEPTHSSMLWAGDGLAAVQWAGITP